jgi:hypothetical protein
MKTKYQEAVYPETRWEDFVVDGVVYEYAVEKNNVEEGFLVTIYQNKKRYEDVLFSGFQPVTKKMVKKFIQDKTEAKFSKVWPDIEGWYWIKYKGKNGLVTCPAKLVILKETKVLSSARNDTFLQRELIDKTLKIGPRIEEP